MTQNALLCYDRQTLTDAVALAARAAAAGIPLSAAIADALAAAEPAAEEMLPREAAEDLYLEAQRHYREQIYDFEAAFSDILARFST